MNKILFGLFLILSFSINLFSFTCQDYMNGNASHVSSAWEYKGNYFNPANQRDLGNYLNDGYGLNVGTYLCLNPSDNAVWKIVTGADSYDIQSFSLTNPLACSSSEIFSSHTNSCVNPPVPTCTDTQYLDANNTCQEKLFAPIPEKDCSGPFTNLSGGYSGQLFWDNTLKKCHVSEPMALSCNDMLNGMLSYFKKSCDTDLNTLKLNCVDGTNEPFKPSLLTHSCEPINKKKIVSPCDDVYKLKLADCNSQNKDIFGKCLDNGMIVTTNTLKCVDKVPKCDSQWHEHLSSDGSGCECDTGYILTTLGDCRTPFPWENDSNLTDEQKTDKTNADNNAHNNKTQDDTNKKTNEKLDKLQNKQDTTNNTLSGLRSDLNTTNNLLNSINDKMSSSSDDVSYSSPNIGTQDKIIAAFGTVSNSIDNITNDYNNLLSTVQKGFSASPVSNGVTPSFSAVVFGRTITLDLCSSFSVFYPIGYFIFTIFFVIIGIKIFLYAFMMGV